MNLIEELQEQLEIMKSLNRSHLVPKQTQVRNAKTGKVYTKTVYVNPNQKKKLVYRTSELTEEAILDREYMQAVKDGVKHDKEFNSIDEVKAFYKGIDKWLKAPNGKDTKLSEKQWCQVRTKNFKKWFGDWEKTAEINSLADEILKMKNVAKISSNAFQKDNVSLTDKVEKYYVDNFNDKVTREKFGEIAIDRRSVKDSIAHGIGSLKAAAFMAVPEVLKRGKIIDYQENWKNRNYDTYVISAPIKIDDTDYICEAIVTKGENRTGFYLYEVEIKEKTQSVFKTAINGTPQASRLILSDIIAKVNKDVSKVVDKNGEPLVVYHGTTRAPFEWNPKRQEFENLTEEELKEVPFTEFEFKQSREGAFFTNSKALAKRYSKTDKNSNYVPFVFEAFLNLKNPETINAGAESATLNPGENTGWRGADNILYRRMLSNKSRRETAEKAMAEGFDGFILTNHSYEDKLENYYQYVAFNPNQIKSATNNSGDFDVKSNNIKKSILEQTREILKSIGA